MNRRQNKLLLSCGLILVVSQLGLSEPVQWSGNGHYYEVIVAPGISWPDAQAAAVAKGGHLATVTSLDELEFVFDLTIDTPGAWISYAEWAVGPWLGARDVGGGTWEWITDEPYEEIHHPDYPDPDDLDLNCTHEVNGDYLIFWGCTPRPVCNDASGSYHSYVIEYDLSVRIEGPSKVVVMGPERNWTALDPKKIMLTATGEPSGGNYSWEIPKGKGDDKAKLRGSVKSQSVYMQVEQASQERDDVVVQVTYTYKSAPPITAQHKMTVQEPRPPTLIECNTTPKSSHGLPYYTTVCMFNSNDQFGDGLVGPYRTMEISEFVSGSPEWYYNLMKKKDYKLTIVKSTCAPYDTCDLTDRIEPPVLFPSGLPVDFRMIRKQYTFIQGWLVDTRRQTLYNDKATSEEWVAP